MARRWPRNGLFTYLNMAAGIAGSAVAIGWTDSGAQLRWLRSGPNIAAGIAGSAADIGWTGSGARNFASSAAA